MRDIDLAYLAGIVDADGYVTATASHRKGRAYFGAQIGITGSRREPHDIAASIFGGNVTSHRPNRDRAHHLTQYHWQIGGRRAVPIIEALLPYLRVKAHRARLVLMLQEQIDLLREFREMGDPAPWQPPDWDPTPSLWAMVEEIREVGVRAGRELDGRTWDGFPVGLPPEAVPGA
ncbi:hypothetical protein [Streptosporangium canum]|uniref:hypothetical protein n=1 Tax=Streptosporangium canum TaxID=324952 RepID=UPI0033B4892D